MSRRLFIPVLGKTLKDPFALDKTDLCIILYIENKKGEGKMKFNHKSLGLFIPYEKFNTGNLEKALNYFLTELGLEDFNFSVGLFKEHGQTNFGIVLRNTLYLREPIREAFSMLTNHSNLKAPEHIGKVSFYGTPYADLHLLRKDYDVIPENMRVDEE